MTDAERLMRPYGPFVCEAASKIAPERVSELEHEVFADKACDLHFENGPANFQAYPGSNKIEATFAGLLSVWAIAKAVLTIANAAAEARNAGKNTIALGEASELATALAYLDAGRNLIRDEAVAWPAGLSSPCLNPPEKSPDWYLNNLFLGATAWILLHEVGHLRLGHQVFAGGPRFFQQEHEADLWATEWILKSPPTPQHAEFRMFCVATGLVWLALIEEVRYLDSKHPPTFQRLLGCLNKFPTVENSPALELAADVLKVAFDPTSQLKAEHAADAYVTIAIRLSRRS